ncbi:phospholipid hydroperoxide glutathione peroxidase [Capsicum annuum]|nr:phospholipid hydroperoxide glutathione peroxidase [Capsicum annuum]
MADPVWDVAFLQDAVNELWNQVCDLQWELGGVRARMLREILRLRRTLLLLVEDWPAGNDSVMSGKFSCYCDFLLLFLDLNMQVKFMAHVSPLLLDDFVEDVEDNCLSDSQEDEQTDLEVELLSKDFNCAYNRLKDIDPVAPNRIHPNNGRKINQYLSRYARFGVIPSKLLQERTVEYKDLRQICNDLKN